MASHGVQPDTLERTSGGLSCEHWGSSGYWSSLGSYTCSLGRKPGLSPREAAAFLLAADVAEASQWPLTASFPLAWRCFLLLNAFLALSPERLLGTPAGGSAYPFHIVRGRRCEGSAGGAPRPRLSPRRGGGLRSGVLVLSAPSEGDAGSPALGEEAAARRRARCFGVLGASPAGSRPVTLSLRAGCFAGTSRGLQLYIFSPGVSDP